MANREGYRDEDNGSDEISADRGIGTTARMRDWKQAFSLPLELLMLLVLGVLVLPLIIISIHAPPILNILIIGIVNAVIALAVIGAMYSQFSGITFDMKRDRLVFPSYSIRRSITLSEILDANSEFAPGGTVFWKILAVFIAVTNRGEQVKPQKHYVVNLAGAFGSRQVRFFSKKRRDQFLSLLRRFAPQVRITRFAAWS